MALSFPSLRINQSINHQVVGIFSKLFNLSLYVPQLMSSLGLVFFFFFFSSQIDWFYLFIFLKSLPVVSSDQPDRNVSALRYAVLLVLITRELHQRDNHCFYIITCSQTVDKAGDHSITSTLHGGPFIFCF